MRWSIARWVGDGRSGGSFTDVENWKVVIHTTETSTVPRYSLGRTAPHYTYDPKSRVFFQHLDTDFAARALRNESGGVQTNRDGVLQLEIVCYSAKWIADQEPHRMWVGDLPTSAYVDIAKWIRAMRREYPFPPVIYSGRRMSPAVWDAFSGITGHGQVPENTHWDPGAFDWELLRQELREVAEVSEVHRPAWEKAEAVPGLITRHTDPKATVTAERLMTFLDRLGALTPVETDIDVEARADIAALRNLLRSA